MAGPYSDTLAELAKICIISANIALGFGGSGSVRAAKLADPLQRSPGQREFPTKPTLARNGGGHFIKSRHDFCGHFIMESTIFVNSNFQPEIASFSAIKIGMKMFSEVK